MNEDRDRLDRITFYSAFESARKEFKPIIKDKKAKIGDKFSYRYADLSSVLDAVTPSLSAYGLVINHSMRYEAGVAILLTELTHILTGFTKTEEYPIKITDDPQKFGSALTYGRRYSVCCLLNVVADDDDDGAIAKDAADKARLEKLTNDDPLADDQIRKSPREKTVTEEERQTIIDYGTKLFGGDVKTYMKKMLSSHGVKTVAELKALGAGQKPSDPENVWGYLSELDKLKGELN